MNRTHQAASAAVIALCLGAAGCQQGITQTEDLPPLAPSSTDAGAGQWRMLVLGGPRGVLLDSLRTIIQRDLDFSDRFEIIRLPQGDSLTLGIDGPPAGAVKPGETRTRTHPWYRCAKRNGTTCANGWRECCALASLPAVLPENCHRCGVSSAFWRMEMLSRGIPQTDSALRANKKPFAYPRAAQTLTA